MISLLKESNSKKEKIMKTKTIEELKELVSKELVNEQQEKILELNAEVDVLMDECANLEDDLDFAYRGLKIAMPYVPDHFKKEIEKLLKEKEVTIC
jgi:hypothetical protein